jgi:hypothetical protein
MQRKATKVPIIVPFEREMPICSLIHAAFEASYIFHEMLDGRSELNMISLPSKMRRTYDVHYVQGTGGPRATP